VKRMLFASTHRAAINVDKVSKQNEVASNYLFASMELRNRKILIVIFIFNQILMSQLKYT
jgi:hypothetical protein